MTIYSKFKLPAIVCLLTTLSCNTVKVDTAIKGNWQSCLKDGTYLEMYVSDSTYKFCFEDIGVTRDNYTYRINGDTLVYTNEDKTRTVRLTYSFSDQETMIWNYFETNEKWEFHRMSGKIREYPLNKFDSATFALYELVKKDVKMRASSYKCRDKRTEKEKYQDSANKQYIFQF